MLIGAGSRSAVGKGSLLYKSDRPKIVILWTGQSNVSNHLALAWTPPPNCYLWQWDGAIDTTAATTGNVYAPMDRKTMGASYAFAAKLATANPGKDIILLNIGVSAQAIAQWKTGASAPDMYAACKRNVESALRLLGLTQIDIFGWWQGETDAINVGTSFAWRDSFETVIARFRGETWFPFSTPMVLMGVSPYVSSVPAIPLHNRAIQQAAFVEPELRTFVNTGVVPQANWDSSGGTPYIHMLAGGYKLAGEVAYNAFTAGPNSGRNAAPVQIIKKTVTETRLNTTTLASDAELQLDVLNGKSYRILGRIFGLAKATPDLKWGLAGPSATSVTWSSISQVGDVPGTLVATIGFTYPTANVVAVGSGSQVYFLNIDVLLNAVSASGRFAFQFAQNTLDASNDAEVWKGSYFEVLEF